MPDLETFIELAHEMGADLVVYHAEKTTTAILRRVTDVNTALARLRIMGHTGRCHLVHFELDGKEIFETQGLHVVRERSVCLLFADYVALCFQIAGLTPVDLNEAVENALG